MNDFAETHIYQPQKTKKPFRKKYGAEIKAYSMIAIPMIWWFVFFVIAFVCSLLYSFTNLRAGLSDITKFTLDNYLRALIPTHKLYDPWFFKSLGVTLIWTVVMMIGNNFMGLLLSFMLMNIKKGRKVFLGLLFWPSLVSAVVGADLSKMLFSSDKSGLMNQILSLFNVGSVAWFDNPNTALFALMITPFLLGFCTKLLIYYAGIVAIPETYYEAARLETTSKSKVFFAITLPLIKNSIVLNVVMSLIDGIKVLGPMQLITGGGPEPGKNTLSSVLYIYQLGFERSRMGQASAYAFILFAIILILTVIQLKLSGKEGESFA